MNKTLVAALVCLGFAAAAKAEVNFDKGVDTGGIAKDAAAIELKWNDNPYYNDPGYPYPGYPYPGHYYPSQPYPGYWGHSPHHMSYSRDCRTFNFGPGSSAMSERIYLDSTEWVEECHYIPDPPPHNPNNPHRPKGMECHQRPGQVFRRTAQLSLLGARKLLPWENERFEVCLQGPWMDLDIEKKAYNYSVHSIGDYDVQYHLTAGNKVAQSPDKDGISMGGFSAAEGKFNFKVNDRWAAEYAGEKVAIRVELYKDGFWFFDSYKGKKEFMFDAATGYDMSFAENELDTSKSFSADFDPSKSFEPAKGDRGATKYYVKWSFRRAGTISTGEYIGKGKTDKIEAK